MPSICTYLQADVFHFGGTGSSFNSCDPIASRKKLPLSLKAQPFLHLFGRESLLLTLRLLENKGGAVKQNSGLNGLTGS